MFGLLQPSTSLADGLDTWITRISGTTAQLKSVTYGNGLFVAVGVAEFPNPGAIVTSPDGITWTSRDSGTPNDLLSVTYGHNLFVAVGSGDFSVGSTILTSPDGITWTSQAPPTPVGLHEALYGITYGNDLFVAVGFAGAILTSPDGVTWADRSQDIGSTSLEQVLYAKGQFVVVGGSDNGSSLIFTSPDGSTWTSRDSGIQDRLYAIAFGNGVYVATGPYAFATGQPVLLTSPDAVTWTSRVLFLTSSGLYGVAYGNGAFVAIGDLVPDKSSLLVTSTDGVTWTRRNSSTTAGLRSVVSGGATFIVVGSSGTIIQSSSTAAPSTQAAAITSPPITPPLPGATATFTWDAGIGVDSYWLTVGTTAGGFDLFSSNAFATNRTQIVSNLPQNGQPIYVRLYSPIGGTNFYRDYVYTAAQPLEPQPDITVQQPVGTVLADGASIGFGNVNLGSSSAAVTFTILNSGTASLTGLAVSKDGTNSADFAVGALGAATLAPNASTTFTVTFTPGGAGARGAALRVASNAGGSKNPFDISLSGSGVTIGGTTSLPLAQALDTSNLTWTTGGDADWTAQTLVTHDGVDAAQSGSVPADSQETWLQTTVSGPGTLSFWWKVDSAENFDYLNFEVDGALQLFISGAVDWEQRTVSIVAGKHTLQWTYSKDVGTVGADAGWVDQVKWTPDSNLANPPTLSYRSSPGKFTLAWPTTGVQYLPEYTDSLVSPNWVPVTETPSTAGNDVVVVVAVDKPTRFFRLRQP